MTQPDNRAEMARAVERFHADVERLAVEIVRAVLGHELARAAAYAARALAARPDPQLELQHTPRATRQPAAVRRAKPAAAVRRAKPAAVRRPKPAAEPAMAETATPSPPVVVLPSPASAPAPAPAWPSDDSLARTTATPDPSPAVIPEPSPPSAARPTGRGRRSPWTRETIVDELATWVSKGTVVDASFLTRHGPPGLVAATKRIFGRFEAAMNVVALQQSKTHAGDPAPR